MKMTYVEPDAYFTDSMKEILEVGETGSTKKPVKKSAKKQTNESKKKERK